MCSKKRTDFLQTVTFRLTLWYTGLFGILSLSVFFLVYVSFTSYLHKQTDSELLDTAKEFNALYETRGVEALRSEFQREARSQGIYRVFFCLLSTKGDVLASSDVKPWGGKTVLRLIATNILGRQPVFQTLSFPGHHHKVRMLLKPTSDGRLIELGITLRDAELMMKRYRETFGTALAVMLTCGGVVGWLLSRKAMAGVQRVTRTANQIREGNLDRRVPLGEEGLEINDLVRAFNSMLDWIEVLVKELGEVTDNIAHDLRSPITRIRGIAETSLTGNPDLEDLRGMAASIIEESDRLVEMINTMLEITKAEAGVAKIAANKVDMRKIVQDATDLFQPLAEDRNLSMQLNIPSQPVFVLGDRARLQRAVANLLDNAIKYTPPGGSIAVSMEIDEARVKVEIADTGIGIDEDELHRIFDRFYRGDKSRSTPGSGLGLSLALAIIRAHYGDITVKSIQGTGSTFTILLPTLHLKGRT